MISLLASLVLSFHCHSTHIKDCENLTWEPWVEIGVERIVTPLGEEKLFCVGTTAGWGPWHKDPWHPRGKTRQAFGTEWHQIFFELKPTCGRLPQNRDWPDVDRQQSLECYELMWTANSHKHLQFCGGIESFGPEQLVCAE